MAVVYKAYDTHLECEEAVKIIRIDNLPRNAEERALKRFEREAKAFDCILTGEPVELPQA